MKCIQISDFPRTQWRESVGLRKVLTAAFNTARKDERRLRSVQALLQFVTVRVNRALVELETGKPLAVSVPAPEPTLPETPPIILGDAQQMLEVPILLNVNGDK